MSLDYLKRRRTVRRYLPEKISPDVIEKLIEAARIAPSARNNQPWKFIVVTKEQTIKALAATSPYKFIESAPLVVAGCALPSNATLGPVPDVIIAMDHMSLAAANMGLGSCWVAGFDRQGASNILQVPENVELVALMTFGYSAEEPGLFRRKDLSEIICWEVYC